MLSDLATASVLTERRAGLQGSRLLQQRFLRMQLYRPTALAPDALRSQWTGRTDTGGEHEVATALPMMLEGGTDLLGRADTGAGLDIDLKGGLRVATLVGRGRHAGHQCPAGIGELLPRRASPVGAIANRLLNDTAGVGLGLLDQG